MLFFHDGFQFYDNIDFQSKNKEKHPLYTEVREKKYI